MPTAIEVRPAIVGALLLTLGLAVTLECAPKQVCMKPGLAVVRTPRPVIVPMDLAPPRTAPGVLVPPDHPDARPWPHGMVITPPVTHDAMDVWLPGPLDKLLSALLGPWLLSQPS